MPYFFILPAFGIAVLLLGGFTIACKVAPSLNPLFPFAWRILLWSTVGFGVANGAVLLLFLVPAFAPEGVPGNRGARGVLKIGLAAGLLVGPFIASALGFMAGSTFGAFLALRSLRSGAGVRRDDRGET